MSVLDIRNLEAGPVSEIRWCNNSDMSVKVNSLRVKFIDMNLCLEDLDKFINALQVAKQEILKEAAQ